MTTITHSLKNVYHTMRITTPVAIIIASIILAVSHVAYGALLSSNTQSSPSTLFKGRAIDESDLVTGNPKSKVFVVEYSDTECPFCAQLHPTITKIQNDYKDKVAFVYRYFPLTQIHPHSFEESRAVFCVGKSMGADKRSAYINDMFAYKLSKQNMVLPQGAKESFAQNLGIDEKAFNSCMTSQESSDAVNTSTQDGVVAGVTGTPSTFVMVKTRKGYEIVALVDGARPYEFFKGAIDEALNR